ncbi:hypothetical protein EDB89DRAFT_1976918 [Lactarius sanguifluus]|nr:hypothetical protein EDB89DRAFT_1976918 [Lactarius sanguifluus]
MMQCMPVRRTSQNWGQPTTQPNDLYPNFNDVFWGSGLQLGDTHEQGMFSSNVKLHNLGYPGSNATAMHPSFIPTPLPVAMGIGFLPLGESPPSEGVGRSEEVDVDLSMRVRELQLEGPMPSTSNSTAGQGGPKKSRKREESGVCVQCNQTFSRKSDVRRHENTAHGREVHACPLCNIICSRKDALQRHIRDQH